MKILPEHVIQFDIDKYLNPFLPRNRLDRLPQPLPHFLGRRNKPQPPFGNVTVAFWAWIGAFCGIAMLEGINMHAKPIVDHGAPLIVGSFGAVAVLDYGCTTVPFAQPRNAVVGNFLAAVVGVSITKLCRLSSDFESIRWLAGALSAATASALMSLTKTIHPPAGATALLAATDPQITQLGWYFLPLVLLGSVLMVAVACILNNIQMRYPMYWWTAETLEPKPRKEDPSADVEDSAKDADLEKFETVESVMSHGGEGVSREGLAELEQEEGLHGRIAEEVLEAMRSHSTTIAGSRRGSMESRSSAMSR